MITRMISLQGSRFRVDCDDDYHIHVYTRVDGNFKEVTKELSENEKDELIFDLIYAISELLKAQRCNTKANKEGESE